MTGVRDLTPQPSSLLEGVRLCVQTLHPIDPHNCDGPIHCTACACGNACATAWYDRRPDSTLTADERHNGILRGVRQAKKAAARRFGRA